MRQKFKSEYQAWCSLRNRCSNPNNTYYDYYGGRGITVCERWDSFENFLSDLGPRPEGLSIDRIDNNGNYEPSNCKWSTAAEQNNNQRMPVNSNGIYGVSWAGKSWMVRRKGKYLGCTKDFFEACCLIKSVEAQFRAAQ